MPSIPRQDNTMTLWHVHTLRAVCYFDFIRDGQKEHLFFVTYYNISSVLQACLLMLPWARNQVPTQLLVQILNHFRSAPSMSADAMMLLGSLYARTHGSYLDESFGAAVFWVPPWEADSEFSLANSFMYCAQSNPDGLRLSFCTCLHVHSISCACAVRSCALSAWHCMQQHAHMHMHVCDQHCARPLEADFRQRLLQVMLQSNLTRLGRHTQKTFPTSTYISSISCIRQNIQQTVESNLLRICSKHRTLTFSRARDDHTRRWKQAQNDKYSLKEICVNVTCDQRFDQRCDVLLLEKFRVKLSAYQREFLALLVGHAFACMNIYIYIYIYIYI